MEKLEKNGFLREEKNVFEKDKMYKLIGNRDARSQYAKLFNTKFVYKHISLVSLNSS